MPKTTALCHRKTPYHKRLIFKPFLGGGGNKKSLFRLFARGASLPACASKSTYQNVGVNHCCCLLILPPPQGAASGLGIIYFVVEKHKCNKFPPSQGACEQGGCAKPQPFLLVPFSGSSSSFPRWHGRPRCHLFPDLKHEDRAPGGLPLSAQAQQTRD